MEMLSVGEMFRFFRPDGCTIYFETVASGGSFPDSNQVIAYIGVAKAMKHFQNFNYVFTQFVSLS